MVCWPLGVALLLMPAFMTFASYVSILKKPACSPIGANGREGDARESGFCLEVKFLKVGIFLLLLTNLKTQRNVGVVAQNLSLHGGGGSLKVAVGY